MPLEKNEEMQLQLLLAKARESDPNFDVSEWEACGFASEAEPEGGAMHDGSKRRESLSPEEPPSKRLPLKSQAGYGSAVVATPWKSSLASSPPEPLSESMHGKPADPVVSKKIFLPPNIKNGEMWGRTVIDFGMFKDKSKTYDDLRNSKSPRAIAYSKWCKARAFSSQGFLRDFAQYLVYMEQQEIDQDFIDGPFIPGTNALRRFK